MELKAIGVINSPYKQPSGTPVQAAQAEHAEARIEVFTEYAPGLADLEGFDYIWLIYGLDRIKSWKLKVIPFLDTVERGIFSTRSPARPNSIGIAAVRLLERNDNMLLVRGVDMLDQTPLYDIKPYVPSIDSRPAKRIGWFDGKDGNFSLHTDDGRFIDN